MSPMTSSGDRVNPAGSGSLVGAGFMLLAALLFGINGSVSKAALTDGGITSVHLVTLRIILAAIVFALIAALRAPASLKVTRRDLGLITAHAIVGVAMVQWLYFVAIARMPVSVTLLIEFTAPLYIALWVRFVHKRTVHGRVWASLLLIIVGLALVARVWHGLTLDGVGLAAAVVAAFSLSVFYLLGERGVGQRDPWSLAAWSFGIAAVFWTIVGRPWTFPFEQLNAPITLSGIGLTGPGWLYLTAVVLLGTVAPFGLSLMGLRRIGAARAGLLATAEPPLAGLLAWPMLGETLLSIQIVGGLVVMAGIVLAESARSTVASGTDGSGGPGGPDDPGGNEALREIARG